MSLRDRREKKQINCRVNNEKEIKGMGYNYNTFIFFCPLWCRSCKYIYI